MCFWCFISQQMEWGGLLLLLLCLYWEQRTKPIRYRFEELNPGSLWPWQRLYLYHSWEMENEEPWCYTDSGGAWQRKVLIDPTSLTVLCDCLIQTQQSRARGVWMGKGESSVVHWRCVCKKIEECKKEKKKTVEWISQMKHSLVR